MKNTVVNSIIFHTQNVKLNKDFYQKLFGFKVGTYEKDGNTLPDESEKYVNFHTDGLLLCFEEGTSPDRGTLVLHVANLQQFKLTLAQNNVEILKQSDTWLKIKDPEARTLIVEQHP